MNGVDDVVFQAGLNIQHYPSFSLSRLELYP